MKSVMNNADNHGGPLGWSSGYRKYEGEMPTAGLGQWSWAHTARLLAAVTAMTRLAAQRPRNLSSVPGRRSTFVSYPVLRLNQPAMQYATGAVQRLKRKANHTPRPQTVLSLDLLSLPLLHMRSCWKQRKIELTSPSTGMINRLRSTSRFWSLWKFISHLNTIKSSPSDCIFGLALLCEEAFSQIKIIQTRYRRRLADEHLQHCLYLCKVTKNHLSVNYRKTFNLLYPE